MRGACCAVGEKRSAYKILSQSLKERNGLEHLGVHWRMILKCVLKKRAGGGVVECGLDTFDSEYVSVAGSCERSSGHLSFIMCWDCLP